DALRISRGTAEGKPAEKPGNAEKTRRRVRKMTVCHTLSELYNGAVPLVVTAHRGASFLCPENTAPAMAKAVELGAHMIEFDLRLSADGVPVLLHDATIDRTSDGRGRPEEHSLAALREFNFAA